MDVLLHMWGEVRPTTFGQSVSLLVGGLVGQLVGLDAGILMNGILCGGIPIYLTCHAHNIEIKNFKYYTGVTTKIGLAHSNYQQIIVFYTYETAAPARHFANVLWVL